MAALTLTIEPDEFLGLSALAELGATADAGHPDATVGAVTEADIVGQARALMRGALADKLAAADLFCPIGRVDHYRHRRLRPAVDVDRLSQEHPVGLARNAARAPGVPDDPASVPAQMDLRQRGRTGRPSP
jgi:hypothetical protein